MYEIPILFTSIIRPMIHGISETDIHAKGRAFDVSAKGWNDEKKEDFERKVFERFADIGAIGRSTGKSTPCLWHEGTAPHCHLQVRP
jgi:hypothetical protein